MNENNVQIDATCANSIELDIIHENELNAKLGKLIILQQSSLCKYEL